MPSKWRWRRRSRRSPASSRRRSGLLLYAGHDEWQAHQYEVDALRDRFTGVKVQLLPSGPLSVLAPAAASGDAVNLLQGALAVASPLQQNWKSWRMAGGARRHAAVPAPRRALSSNSRDCTRAKPRWMPASRTPSAPPCPASRTRPMRAAASRHGWRRSMAAAAAAHCCPHCRPSPMRAAPPRPPTSRASLSATARSSCASPRRTPPVSMPSASNCAPRSWQADILGGSANGDSYRGRLQVKQGGRLMREWYANLAERERRFVLHRRDRRPWCCCCPRSSCRSTATSRRRASALRAKQVTWPSSRARRRSSPPPGPAARGRPRRVAGGAHRQFGARKRPRQVAVEQPAHG